MKELDKLPDELSINPKLQLHISKSYCIQERVGKGSYGQVYRGYCLTSGKIVALKILENQCSTEYDTIKVLREVKLLKKLKSGFVT